jgi:hypothetical protein
MGSPASQTRRERVSVYWTGWPRAQSDPTSGLDQMVFAVGIAVLEVPQDGRSIMIRGIPAMPTYVSDTTFYKEGP